MDPAPDLATLFQFEAQFETAMVVILGNAGVPAFRRKGATRLPTPRVEVMLHPGAPTGHRFSPPNAQTTPAQTYPDAFHAQLVLTTVTDRTEVPGNAERHDELVGKSRVAMLDALAALNAQLVYLGVQKIDALGVIPRIEAEADLDVSPLVFGLQFCIRTGAWPLEITAPAPVQ